MLCNNFMVRCIFDASTVVCEDGTCFCCIKFGYRPHRISEPCELASRLFALQESRHIVALVSNSTKLVCEKKSFPVYFGRHVHLMERAFQPLKECCESFICTECGHHKQWRSLFASHEF
jgi:hypothetical protein